MLKSHHFVQSTALTCVFLCPAEVSVWLPVGIKSRPANSTYTCCAAPDVASQQVDMSGEHTGTMEAFIISTPTRG